MWHYISYAKNSNLLVPGDDIGLAHRHHEY